LFKINANGQLLWEKTYGFVGIDVGYDGITTPDGGFLLAASLDVTASGGAGNQTAKTKRHAGGDYWLIKTDAEGNTIWSQYYGGLFTDTPCCVVPHPDGGYLIAGTSDSSDFDVSKNLGSYDIWLVRVAANGELLWEKNYGGQQIDSAAAVLSTGDENFILVGTTRSSDQDVIANKGGADIWVLKIDGQGELLWTKNYGGSNFDTAVAAVYNAKNEIIISGNSRSDDGDLNKNQGHNDAWMLVLDSKGNIQNQYTWGGPQTDILNAATQPDKNTFFLLGTTDSPQIGTGNTYGFSDVFISKVSAQ
jgi:hypothetical protein